MMRSIAHSAIAVGIAVTAAAASDLRAQTASECSAAAKIVSSGNVRTSEEDAFLTLAGCGTVGANAYATGIPKLANVSDTVRLGTFMDAADAWRDAGILAASTQLANNESAKVQARVYAIRHLMTLVQPLCRAGYAGLVVAADTTALPDGSQSWTFGCQTHMVSEPLGYLDGTVLPATYKDQIRATLTALAGSPSTPKQVRAAASCIL